MHTSVEAAVLRLNGTLCVPNSSWPLSSSTSLQIAKEEKKEEEKTKLLVNEWKQRVGSCWLFFFYYLIQSIINRLICFNQIIFSKSILINIFLTFRCDTAAPAGKASPSCLCAREEAPFASRVTHLLLSSSELYKVPIGLLRAESNFRFRDRKSKPTINSSNKN